MSSKQVSDQKKYKNAGKSSFVPAIVAVLIVIVALISGFAIHMKQQSEYARLLRKQEALQDEYNQLRSDNVAVEAEINSIDSDDYVKRIAREVLGMVWPNEVIFKQGEEAPAADD